MDELYNKHYIRTDGSSRITYGFSDAFEQPGDTDICINEQGGRQFRLFPDGEENPHLSDGEVWLYKHENGAVTARTEAETDADKVPDLETTRSAKVSELDAAAQAAIIAGCDVTLSDETTGHISLTAEDQINLSTAQAAVQAGATGYPYHLDGQLCAVYSAADIQTLAQAATEHILYHATYCNHLLTWARRAETVEDLDGITYGAALPDDLKTNMEAVLNAA